MAVTAASSISNLHSQCPRHSTPHIHPAPSLDSSFVHSALLSPGGGCDLTRGTTRAYGPTMTTGCSRRWGVGCKSKEDGRTNTSFGCFTPLREVSHELHSEGVGCARFMAFRAPDLLLSRILALMHLAFSSASNMRVGLPELWRQYCDL